VLTGTQAVTASQVGTATFAAYVAGEEIVFKATGVQCVGCEIGNSPTVGTGTGKLRFTGVSVARPSPPCTTTATVETKEPTFSANFMEGTSAWPNSRRRPG
jgi:hypothetical protein